MALVKIQNVMSNELAKRVIFSRPPEPPQEFLLNDPTNSIFIGITKLFGVPFTWTFANLTNPHISVVGITGAGKSFFVKTFLTRASYVWKTNAIIIDWAGEYKAWVQQSGGITVALGKGDYLNIMDLSGMKPLDRSKQILTSLEILTDMSDYPEQKRLTEEAIEQAYVNAGFNLAEIPPAGKDAPTLKEVINLLEEKLQEGTYAYPAELENAVYRLRQFAREGEDYFAKKSTLDLGKLITSGLVDIDLSSLPDERFRALAALFILQTLKEKMRMEGWNASKGLKALVVLDEAWKIAGDERSDAVTIIREGRKYQFGLIVASQNPTDINEAIFSNVGHVHNAEGEVREVPQLPPGLAQLLQLHEEGDKRPRRRAGRGRHVLPDLGPVPGGLPARQDSRGDTSRRLHHNARGRAQPGGAREPGRAEGVLPGEDRPELEVHAG